MKTSLISAVVVLVAISTTADGAPEGKEPVATGEFTGQFVLGNLVRTINWSDVPPPAGAKVQNKPGSSPTLLLKHDGSNPLQVPLWKLDQPGISKKCYALRGKVRYKDVTGIGYFELWNDFPAEKRDGPKTRYFSRSLAKQGPFSQITGNSDWRELILPFDASQSPTSPSTLELNLSLAGAGEVEVTSLTLLEYDDATTMWATIGVAVSSSPALPEGATSNFAMVILILAGLAAAGGFVWTATRKGRQRAEERRMKAMDAMP